MTVPSAGLSGPYIHGIRTSFHYPAAQSQSDSLLCVYFLLMLCILSYIRVDIDNNIEPKVIQIITVNSTVVLAIYSIPAMDTAARKIKLMTVMGNTFMSRYALPGSRLENPVYF